MAISGDREPDIFKSLSSSPTFYRCNLQIPYLSCTRVVPLHVLGFHWARFLWEPSWHSHMHASGSTRTLSLEAVVLKNDTWESLGDDWNIQIPGSHLKMFWLIALLCSLHLEFRKHSMWFWKAAKVENHCIVRATWPMVDRAGWKSLSTFYPNSLQYTNASGSQ